MRTTLMLATGVLVRAWLRLLAAMPRPVPAGSHGLAAVVATAAARPAPGRVPRPGRRRPAAGFARPLPRRGMAAGHRG